VLFCIDTVTGSLYNYVFFSLKYLEKSGNLMWTAKWPRLKTYFFELCYS